MPDDSLLRVAVVHPDVLYQDLLCLALPQFPGFQVVATFGHPVLALERIPALEVDVVVADGDLGDVLTGIRFCGELRRKCPGVGIVLLSDRREPEALSILTSGSAAGWAFLLKRSAINGQDLRRAIEGAARGLVTFDPQMVTDAVVPDSDPIGKLAPRGREILRLMAKGHSNSAIAKALGLADKSIENQVSQLYQALGIDSSNSTIHPRVSAALRYLQHLDKRPAPVFPATRRNGAVEREGRLASGQLGSAGGSYR